MSTPPQTPPSAASAVSRLVPFVHVADVEASLAFYALLGFAPQRVIRDPAGSAFWSLAQSGSAEIMLARAEGPIDAHQQAVVFYMYSPDVAALQRHLLDSGVTNGGTYHGGQRLVDRHGEVFHVAHPDHMPAGELRVADPDGYIILVGQLS